MQLIDGYNGGVAHISASMIRDHNLSLYGDNDCVLPVGNKFSYEVVDNNTIRISDGMAIIGGARATIEYGQTETAIIENGVSGYKRNDIIVIEYSKDNETLIESAAVKVVKGSIGSSGVDPNLVTGDVRAGATVKQMALYRVKVNGLSIEGVETLWTPAVLQGADSGKISGIICSPNSTFTIPKTVADGKIPLSEDISFGQNLFKTHPLGAGEITRNYYLDNINKLWKEGTTKKVHVEFCFYFFNGFTSGERVMMYLYDGNKEITGARWNYYVKSASPYTMYSGSVWVDMKSDSELNFRLACTSGKGTVNPDATRVTVTTWD